MVRWAAAALALLAGAVVLCGGQASPAAVRARAVADTTLQLTYPAGGTVKTGLLNPDDHYQVEVSGTLSYSYAPDPTLAHDAPYTFPATVSGDGLYCYPPWCASPTKLFIWQLAVAGSWPGWGSSSSTYLDSNQGSPGSGAWLQGSCAPECDNNPTELGPPSPPAIPYSSAHAYTMQVGDCAFYQASTAGTITWIRPTQTWLVLQAEPVGDSGVVLGSDLPLPASWPNPTDNLWTAAPTLTGTLTFKLVDLGPLPKTCPQDRGGTTGTKTTTTPTTTTPTTKTTTTSSPAPAGALIPGHRYTVVATGQTSSFASNVLFGSVTAQYRPVHATATIDGAFTYAAGGSEKAVGGGATVTLTLHRVKGTGPVTALETMKYRLIGGVDASETGPAIAFNAVLLTKGYPASCAKARITPDTGIGIAFNLCNGIIATMPGARISYR